MNFYIDLFVVVSIVSCISGEVIYASFVDINAQNNLPPSEHEQQTKFRLPPKQFAGPEHFKFFGDFCMKKVSNNSAYSYTVCPFHNVTQLDTDMVDAVDVAIGSWHGWIIENNTYRGWHFYAGDPCSGEPRQAFVHFECGPSNVLSTVTEPQKCQYHFTMKGPTFCNPDALLVYPYLKEKQQQKWDVLYTHYMNKEINQQVYEELVNLFLAQYGLVLSESDKDAYKEAIKIEEPKKFDNLDACEREYHLLKKENDILKSMTSKDSLKDLEIQMDALRNQEFMEGQAGGHHNGMDYMDYGHRFDYGRSRNRDL